MTGSRDWKSGGDAGPEPTPDRPALPPHLDPRRPRGGLPPRPPRTSPPGRPAARPVLPSAPPKRRRRAARVLSWIAVVTSAAVLLTAGGLWALVNFYDGKITRIPGLQLGSDRPDDLPRDAQNILIVGSDSRGDLAPGEGPQGTGDDFVTGQRSDTVILAHLYGDADAAQLVSFPRDSWVTIPEHVDADSGEVVEAHEGKLNPAFFQGGPELLIKTIQGLTGLYVDHYLQIDFDGFQRIVNELDGVEVCLSEPAKEKDSGIDLDAGRQVIKGDQALAFVRQRKGLPRGDIDRIARQQQFIGAIVREVLSAGTLLNPVRVNGVISIATESLEVDEGLQIDDLQELAFRFRSFDAGGVVFTTAPVGDINGRRGGQDVVLLDEAAGQQLWDTIRRDVAPQTATEEPARRAAGGAHRGAVRDPRRGVQRGGRDRPGPARGRRPRGARLPDRRRARGPRHHRDRHRRPARPGQGRQRTHPGRSDPGRDHAAGRRARPHARGRRRVLVRRRAAGAGHPGRPAGRWRGLAGAGHRRHRPLRGVTPLQGWTAGLVGDRDPAQPLLTLLDGPARVELSGATTANWVAKSANLLVDGLGSPRRVGLVLPLHWQAVVLLLAGVATGAQVDVGALQADAVLTTPDRVDEADADDVLALSGHPLGAPCTGLPPSVADYAREVPGHGDHWSGRPPATVDVRVGGARVEPRGLPLGPADRVLLTGALDDAAVLAALLGVLHAGAALLLVPDPSSVDLARTAEQERATATAGVRVDGLPLL